jgi:cyclopropane fatty-acyl-phospholipid synthase-like methyltransferase
MLDPKRIVAEGYDQIAERHAAWAAVVRAQERARYTDLLLRALAEGAAVLELGCGAGGPTSRALASRFHLTGVDISARSIELARADLPQACFIHADMMKVELPPSSFDAVAAFYSIIHVPREEHAALFARVASWLRPGGLFVAAIGACDTESEYDPDWLGTPMYWSGYDEPTGCLLIEAAGFVIEQACVETADEDGQWVPFLWIVARRGAAGDPSTHTGAAA